MMNLFLFLLTFIANASSQILSNECQGEYNTFYDSINILTYFSKALASSKVLALSVKFESNLYQIDLVFPEIPLPPRLAFKVSYLKDNFSKPPREELIVYKSGQAQGSLKIVPSQMSTIFACQSNTQGNVSCTITVTAFHVCTGVIYSTSVAQIVFKTDDVYTVALPAQSITLKVEDEDLPPTCLLARKCKLDKDMRITFSYCNQEKHCANDPNLNYDIDSIAWVRPNIFFSNSDVAVEYKGEIAEYSFDLYSKDSDDELVTTIQGVITRVIKSFDTEGKRIFGFPLSLIEGSIDADTFLKRGGNLRLTISTDVTNPKRNLEQERELDGEELPSIVYSSVKILYDQRKFFKSSAETESTQDQINPSLDMSFIIGIVAGALTLTATVIIVTCKLCLTKRQVVNSNAAIPKEDYPVSTKTPEDSTIRVYKRGTIKYLKGIPGLSDKSIERSDVRLQTVSSRRISFDDSQRIRLGTMISKKGLNTIQDIKNENENE